MTKICKNICINMWATKHNKQTQISKNQIRKLNVVEYTYILITQKEAGVALKVHAKCCKMILLV